MGGQLVAPGGHGAMINAAVFVRHQQTRAEKAGVAARRNAIAARAALGKRCAAVVVP